MKETAIFLAALGLLPAAWGEPAQAVVKDRGEIDWQVSGNLPPGAEFHLIREDKATHAVEMLARFVKGYSLPPHSHTADETILVLKGKLSVGLAGRTQALRPGSYAVIPGAAEHSLKVLGWGSCEMLVILNGPYDVKGLPSVK